MFFHIGCLAHSVAAPNACRPMIQGSNYQTRSSILKECCEPRGNHPERKRNERVPNYLTSLRGGIEKHTTVQQCVLGSLQKDTPLPQARRVIWRWELWSLREEYHKGAHNEENELYCQ